MKRILLALIVMLALASMSMGATFAGFCDTETSEGNTITTGSLDLKVALANGNAGGNNFRDDEPWGVGLDPCFYEPVILTCSPYTSNLKLWNAGSCNGIAHLKLEIVHADPPELPSGTYATISYDVNGDNIPEQIASGTLGGLACIYHALGSLPSNHVRPLSIQVHFPVPLPGNPAPKSLAFKAVFGLTSAPDGFCDTEVCSAAFGNACTESGGTPGFWRNPGAVKLYGKDQIAAWFAAIVGSSNWYTDIPITGVVDADYATMCAILKASAGNAYGDMVAKFRSQYLATKLNAAAGRMGPDTLHDISGIPGASGYFGFSSGTLAQITATIESMASGGIFTEPPSKGEMELMKDVCDYLNNP